MHDLQVSVSVLLILDSSDTPGIIEALCEKVQMEVTTRQPLSRL